jgi:hypothetical protein
MTYQEVLAAASRIAGDNCDRLPPCEANDAYCACVRLAKLALNVGDELDVTAAYDKQADRDAQPIIVETES